MRRVILFVVLGLTGCAVATGSRTSTPITSSYSAASISVPRFGGSAAGDRASVSGRSVLGAGSFPGGKSPDMCSPGAQHRDRALRNVREVPLPASAPVYGNPGPLIERWRPVSRG